MLYIGNQTRHGTPEEKGQTNLKSLYLYTDKLTLELFCLCIFQYTSTHKENIFTSSQSKQFIFSMYLQALAAAATVLLA